jgi:small subunit ribosomal protein S13
MPRIAGVDLPPVKRMEVALTYIYGIGQARARKILEKTGVDPDLRAKDLPESDTAKLRTEIESHYKVEGALRSEMSMNIKRLMDIGCYRGLRHRRGLPVRDSAPAQARTGGPEKGAGLTKSRKTTTTAPKAGA